jgi:hypothetical protein
LGARRDNSDRLDYILAKVPHKLVALVPSAIANRRSVTPMTSLFQQPLITTTIPSSVFALLFWDDSWLFEQPLIIVALGVAVILGLAAAWSASGRKEWLFGIAAALVLLIAGLVTERLVVTDREAIRATLQQIARDVRSNDRQAVLRHVHSTVPELKKKAAAELPNYEFTQCRVTKIHKIDVDRDAEPHSAMVEFNVIASGTFRQSGFEVTDTVPRWVRLHMLREKDGRWTVVDYEHDDPQRMILRQPQEK